MTRSLLAKLKWSALTLRQQLLLAIPASLVIVVMLARFLYLPLVYRIRERLTTLRDLHVKLSDAKMFVGRRAAQEAAWQKAQEQYRAVESRIGSGQSVAHILELLSDQAKAHHLELVAIQPRAAAEGQRVVTLGPDLAVREIPLTLQLTGRYRNLGEFLGRFPEAPFLSSIREMTITKPQAESAQIRADVTLAVYLAERLPTG